ncbi:MAG: hypothetical protein K6L74_14425 [Neptuniibacter sp.]
MTTQRLTKRNRFITAILAVVFVVYCSVGVCTDLISTAEPVDDAHAHHNMEGQVHQDILQQFHCDSSDSCQWSLNLVSDPVSFDELGTGYALAYLVSSATLILMVLSLSLKQRRRYAYALNNLYQPSYPRLHLQKSVFLN